MNFFAFLFGVLCWALLASLPSLAQCQTQSSTQPLPTSAARHYVVIPAAEAATHVKTRRLRANRAEYLELLNVRLPSSFVRQKLLDTQDITLLTGLFAADELLVTLAILPDPRTGQVTWVPIDLDSVATRQVSWARVAADCYTRLFNFEAARNPKELYAHRRMDFQPVVKRGQQYFTPHYQVLTEYFVLRNYPAWYPTSGDNALINCLAHPFTPLDYAAQQTAVGTSELRNQPVPFLRGELAGRLFLRQVVDQEYYFWSMPFDVVHGGVAEHGVEEFRFRPGIGLVSGKYPSYFNLDGASDSNIFFDTISVSKL